MGHTHTACRSELSGMKRRGRPRIDQRINSRVPLGRQCALQRRTEPSQGAQVDIVSVCNDLETRLSIRTAISSPHVVKRESELRWACDTFELLADQMNSDIATCEIHCGLTECAGRIASHFAPAQAACNGQPSVRSECRMVCPKLRIGGRKAGEPSLRCVGL